MLGVAVSAEHARAMGRHARELIVWNQTTNLTAITDPLDVAVKHYVDSVAAAPHIGVSANVLDAGSGGGFPGIPLAILRPDLTVTLVDSVRKKISFVTHAIRTLGLQHIDAVHGRLEMLARQDAHRHAFDVVICRAFSSLQDFAALARAFVAPGGCLLALKGPRQDLPEEMPGGGQAAMTTRIGGAPFSIHVHRYRLPILNSRRRLVRLVPLNDDR